MSPTISGGVGGGGAVTLIASQTLAAPAATVDFAAIASTFNHLVIVAMLRTDSAAPADSVAVRFNNDSGANYDRQTLSGVNVTAAAGVASAATSLFVGNAPAATATAAHFGTFDILIPGYAGANTKVLRSVCGASPVAGTATNYEASVQTGSWRSTAAIARVTFLPLTGVNFAAGSVAFLYGLT